ncbi:Uma2 family endonuclease [Streptosporangium sp. NPDC000396]|uniref:Uma2 family endonuclease n=1 Tax=Streptosporangium sp. NPDC000396 TaxID=3366185 RepID=UPI003698E9A2
MGLQSRAGTRCHRRRDGDARADLEVAGESQEATQEGGAEVGDPKQVHVVAEITLASTASTDRIIKPAKYAAAGIPHFWRIEMRPFRGQGNDALPVVFTYTLDENGEYQLVHRVSAGMTADLTEPFKLRLDPAALGRI